MAQFKDITREENFNKISELSTKFENYMRGIQAIYQNPMPISSEEVVKYLDLIDKTSNQITSELLDIKIDLINAYKSDILQGDN